MDRIKESDWKLLSRKLKPQALDDFCERVFPKSSNSPATPTARGANGTSPCGS